MGNATSGEAEGDTEVQAMVSWLAMVVSVL